MQEIPEVVMRLIAERMSLQDVASCRRASLFFSRKFAQSYLNKIASFILQKTVKQVARGQGFELILLNDGTVYGRGKNEFGALGQGETVELKQFTQIKGLPPIKQIVANFHYAYYLAKVGDVYITGQDRLHLITGHSRLALLDASKKINCRTPYKVPALSKITTMSISTKTSFFVSESGKVFGCGTNDDGQVLPGSRGVMQALVEIPNISNAKNVFAGIFHTIIQCGDYFNSFGSNSAGQLCLGHCRGIPGVHTFKLDFQPEKIHVTAEATYFLNDNDQLYLSGKAAQNEKVAAKTYKKLECVGSAKDWPSFIRQLETPEINVPHEQLIPEIVELCKNPLDDTVRTKNLPPALVAKLNEFSQFLKTTTTDAIEISDSKNDFQEQNCPRN
jgi:hypothetical protein